MKPDYELGRALAGDDHLDLRRARRAAAQDGGRDDRCETLYDYEELCDQCGRRTRQPHVAAGRTFCRRCCPACIRIALRMTRVS
jgi:hypothetical protein